MLRTQIKGAIIPGFLGIGEPLIYGVTLPRMKPFITACIGRCLRRLFPRSDRVAGPAGGAEYGLWPFWPRGATADDLRERDLRRHGGLRRRSGGGLSVRLHLHLAVRQQKRRFELARGSDISGSTLFNPPHGGFIFFRIIYTCY